jgi:hypothetical protein
MNQLAQKIWRGCEIEVVELEGAFGGLVILWDPDFLTMDIH